MKLSDIVVPNSITIEDYGNRRPSKVYISGRYRHCEITGRLKWYSAYCTIRDSVRPDTVDGTVGALKLIRQIGGADVGKLVAFIEPMCMIGSHRIGVVDSLGDCILPFPFETLDDISR